MVSMKLIAHRSPPLPPPILLVSNQPTKPPTQQASTNYKEAFALFDKRGNGRVALESLGDLLRACGQNPTLAEIRELEKGVGGDCKTHIYLFIFLKKKRKEKRKEKQWKKEHGLINDQFFPLAQNEQSTSTPSKKS